MLSLQAECIRSIFTVRGGIDMPKDFVHPYLPNSVPSVKEEMLREIGVEKISDIYTSVIPDDLLYKERLHLPEAIVSEYELRKHVTGLLKENKTCEDYISFLGAGCYRHQIPAICDEIANRGEFLTGYCGDTYSDHGKMQAIFEYASMMGELLDCDIVSYTTYDAGQSVVSAMRMAIRLQEKHGTPRSVVLVPGTMNPEIRSQAEEYVRSAADLVTIAYDKATGLMDLDDLKNQLEKKNVAAVYIENPTYLGHLEAHAEEIAAMAHAYGAYVIVLPEVASLGVMESPINYGADIVVGDIQPLGMHMQFGGGQAGFIVCAQNLDMAEEFPTYMYGIAETDKENVYGWGRAMNYRCSHGSRENAREFFGTETGLWGITAGIYLAAMGPQGMYELGETILQKTAYAIKMLSDIPGITVDPFGGCHFQEFVIDFRRSGLTVSEVNRKLLDRGIFGGKDLSKDFPELGECALYCISELTADEEVVALKQALEAIVGGGKND